MTPLYVGSEIYRHSSYGPKHPLAVPRVSVCTDLSRALGWLPDAVYHDAPIATGQELTRFHVPAYIAALRQAEADQAVTEDIRTRFRIGAEGNAVYPEVYRRPAISAGGVMMAARLAAEGRIVHCPGGGTHHGRPDRASGFCFLNDPVARPRSGEHRLSRHRRTSRRRRAGRVSRRRPGVHDQPA
jgi:acetoin utilization protein AcuC